MCGFLQVGVTCCKTVVLKMGKMQLAMDIVVDSPDTHHTSNNLTIMWYEKSSLVDRSTKGGNVHIELNDANIRHDTCSPSCDNVKKHDVNVCHDICICNNDNANVCQNAYNRNNVYDVNAYRCTCDHANECTYDINVLCNKCARNGKFVPLIPNLPMVTSPATPSPRYVVRQALRPKT